MFTERNKETDAMELRRDFRVEKGDRIFAVEDIILTGKSVKESIEVVRALGAEVVGVGCLIDRSGGKARTFDVPLKAPGHFNRSELGRAGLPALQTRFAGHQTPVLGREF